MPRLNKETKDQIKQLDIKSLQEIVVKLAAKDKIAFDFIKVNYLDKESGEQELFEEAKSDLTYIFMKSQKGYAPELKMAKTLAECVRRINAFGKVSTNKIMEADLLVFVLEEAFSVPDKMFGTCFTQFDNKVASILNRLINIVTKKLHQDYLNDYQDSINNYLKRLHKNAFFVPKIRQLPESI